MNAKRRFVFLLTIILIFAALCVPVDAQEQPEFEFEVTVDGEDTVELNTGDMITVTLFLNRTDKDEPYTMYAMQSELRYDSSYFELVEDSVFLHHGVEYSDIAREGDYREFYMNFLSMSGGIEWQPRTRVGSFQLRVIATQGVTTITNEDFLVSNPYHENDYVSMSNALTVILNSECLVRFESNGGTPVESQSIYYGEKVTRPEDPTREGMTFEGWFKDFRLTQPWDFDNDVVEGNMRLYAKWEPVETQPPETEPPETEPPETEPPVTEPPVTEPPVTDPEEDTSEPEEDTSEPEEDTSEPEEDTSEPEEDTSEPEEDTSEPEEDTSEPEEDTSEPEEDTSEPEEDTSEPEEDTSEPEEDTSEPEDETTELPTTETDPPETGTESDRETETDPPEQGSETETQPGVIPQQPKKCLLCGNATNHLLCMRCSIILWACLCTLALLLFVIIMYCYFRFYNKERNKPIQK